MTSLYHWSQCYHWLVKWGAPCSCSWQWGLQTLLANRKWNLCLQKVFPTTWDLESLPPGKGHRVAPHTPCYVVPWDPRLSRLWPRHPLHWGRGWRKESRALIRSICSVAANWIVSAEGKTMDTVVTVTPARNRHSETSHLAKQICSSAQGEGPTTLPNTALPKLFLRPLLQRCN